MSTIKDFRFHVDASPAPECRVRVTSNDKQPLDVVTPPEFRGGTPGEWTPEDLLVASVASCYALTLETVAARRGLSLLATDVEAAGHVTLRADGRLGFVVIELKVSLAVERGLEREAEKTARLAEERCLISRALAVPVELELEVVSREPARVAS